MRRCDPEIDQNYGDRGFATALAMGVSLALGLTVTVLLVRTQQDVIQARHQIERSQAEYRFNATQLMAARSVQARGDLSRPQTFEFDGLITQTTFQVEAAKLSPAAAAKLPDNWLEALGVASPAGLRLKIERWPADQTLSMTQLSELDPSPAWKACAANVISASGSSAQRAAAIQSNKLALPLPNVLRFTAVGGDGMTDDRIVRLTADALNPVLVLDRRFYRRRVTTPSCPPTFDFASMS